jgi:hypothetical protein
MMITLFKLIGAAGIILISIGILARKRIVQDSYYVLGGICLEAYSIYIGDMIFIVLQILFTSAALHDIIKIRVLKK